MYVYVRLDVIYARTQCVYMYCETLYTRTHADSYPWISAERLESEGKIYVSPWQVVIEAVGVEENVKSAPNKMWTGTQEFPSLLRAQWKHRHRITKRHVMNVYSSPVQKPNNRSQKKKKRCTIRTWVTDSSDSPKGHIVNTKRMGEVVKKGFSLGVLGRSCSPPGAGSLGMFTWQKTTHPWLVVLPRRLKDSSVSFLGHCDNLTKTWLPWNNRNL